MKRFLLASTLLLTGVSFAFSQTVSNVTICLKTLAVTKNGAGTGTTYPGFGTSGDNNYQAPDANYKLSGQVTVSFTNPLPSDIAPPAILSIAETSPLAQTFDYKFAYTSIQSNRLVAVYNFYGTTSSSNLPNGSQVLYTVKVQFLNSSENSCAGVINQPPPSPLPVHFVSFSTSENNQSTTLSWVTGTEQENKGFYVQRNTDGQWVTVAFIPSAAQNGTSFSDLNYTYTDNYLSNGKVQYRIAQVDYNGNITYSSIRIVDKNAAAGFTLYPNPGTGGKVNVAFSTSAPKDIAVFDLSGKQIQQFSKITGGLTIDNLKTGFYIIKITDLTASTTSVGKIMIQ